MTNHQWTGIAVLLGLVSIALFGGIKNTGSGPYSKSNLTPQQQQIEIQSQIYTTSANVQDLKQKIAEAESAKNASEYKGLVNLYYVVKAEDPAQEYVTLHADPSLKGSVDITGWTLKSLNSGQSVQIPQGVYLYFADQKNGEEDVRLTSNDYVYIVTGRSPNSYSFKVNKCTGYVDQDRKIYPPLSNMCPYPSDENLSSIPKTSINDSCLDFINSLPRCETPTNLQANWSYECTHFLTQTLTYGSCVDNHKSDSDFYQHEWRIYLKRSETLWKTRRETIVLYDNLGKVVSAVTY
jgi:hypothetical protein